MGSALSLHIEQVGHVTVASMQWQAPAAWSLVRAWRRGAWRWWIAAGIFLGLAAATNLYYLAYLSGPLLVAAVALGRSWTKQRARGALVAAGLAAAFAVPMVIPYLTRQAVVGHGYGTVSTDVLSFVGAMAGRPLDSLLLPAVPFTPMQPAQGLFPGFAVLVLAWLGWRTGYARSWAIYALCCFILALGPYVMVDGHVLPFPLPYAALSAVVPHFALFRDPTRATAGLALGLAVAAAWGTRALLVRAHHGHLRLAALIVALVALESWTPLPTARLAPIPAGDYWLARQPAIHAIAVLPMANDTLIDWEHQTELMRESTVTWKPMVNGSESLDPVGMAQRRAVLATYPAPAAQQMLRRLRVDAVVLRLAWLSPGQRSAMLRVCAAMYRDAVMAVCRVSPASGSSVKPVHEHAAPEG